MTALEKADALIKAQEEKQGWSFDDIQQKFCPKCGGIKVMTVKGKKISPFDFPKYQVACDAGCICR